MAMAIVVNRLSNYRIGQNFVRLHAAAAALPVLCRRCGHIDKTIVPELDERDLEEHFVRGSGPGGQNVNKASNCVVLKHAPTGIVLKCHESRLLHVNRHLAREWMRHRLDEAINGEASVAAQRRRLDERKSVERNRRCRLREKMKRAFKERENID